MGAFGKGRFLIVAALLVALPTSDSTAALAGFCMQPRAPSFFARKPSKPFCAMDRSCDQWEVDNYKSDIERYFRSLKSYLGEVDTYYEEAYAYAKCMSDLD